MRVEHADRGGPVERPGGGSVAERLAALGALVMAGRSADAVALGEPMLAELDPERSRRERLQLLSWLGPAYVDLRRMEDCLAATTELVDLAGGEPSAELASALCVRGVVLTRARQENQGLADLRAAAALVQPDVLDTESLFGTVNVLASASANVGLYEAAERYCLWGETLAEKGHPYSVAYHLETWAWLHAEWAATLDQEGDGEGARQHVRRVGELAMDIRRAAAAIVGADQLGHDVMSLDATALLALVAAWEGRPREALALLDGMPAEPIARPGHNPALAVLLARALAHRALGDDEAAARAAREAADMAGTMVAERWQAEAYRILRDVTSDAGTASAAGERFEALFDGLGWQLRLRALQLAPPT